MAGRGTCGLCGAAATLRCGGGCGGGVRYCGREHQRKHWPQHRAECWPFARREDPRVGRYLVASRDLKEGQLVVREEPLVLGPAADSRPLCLGCHAPIREEGFPRCRGCSWPLCSPSCGESPRHRQECRVLATDSRRIGAPKGLAATPRYDVVLSLRCLLLRESDPEGWAKVAAMESHAEGRWADGEPRHRAVVRYLSEVLDAGCDEATARHVHGAVVTNAVNTSGGASGGEALLLRGLYPAVAAMNHSCRPNVTLRSAASGALLVRTALPVRRGEPLAFSYVAPAEPLWRRQADLRGVYYFACGCERCGDPTELGTHFSSPKCPGCENGFLEPGGGPGAPWACPRCGEGLPEEEVRREVEGYEREVEEKCGTVDEARQLLDRIEAAFHPNHFVWMKAAKAALAVLRREKSSPAALSMQRDLWGRLIHLHERLEPGSTRRRGVSLYCAGVVEKEAALLHLAESGTKKPSKAFEDGMTRAVRMLDTAIQVLSLEPEDSTEVRWLQKARAERQGIYDLIGG